MGVDQLDDVRVVDELVLHKLDVLELILEDALLRDRVEAELERGVAVLHRLAASFPDFAESADAEALSENPPGRFGRRIAFPKHRRAWRQERQDVIRARRYPLGGSGG